MDERMRFVARLMEGEKMAVLCREFDISRKTGYKIFNAVQDCWPRRFDRSQPPTVSTGQPAALSDREADSAAQAESTRPGVRPKIREKIKRLHSGSPLPAISTVHAVLDRHGLVDHARRPATRPRERTCRCRPDRTICGAPTTRVSSCSPINAIAIR